MNKLILPFQKLTSKDVGLAGGKGASLGEMTQAGIPVPPGFVILSESFERFIKETDLVQEIDAILHKVNHKEIHTVEAASEEIRELILNAEMPKDIADEIHGSFKKLNAKYVAVRSSATAEDGKDHAWAGQLESYLNTTESEILTKVKLCWSSLFTPRAIFYRFEKGLHSTKISVAVVIQKMVESEISGIAFSVHPVTEDRNQLIIEAGLGLGEAIVSGSVTPDSYVVEKNPRNILDINISTQNRGLYRSEIISAEHGNNEWRDIAEPKASSQVLTKEQILELSKIILNIENHYGFPCDIEWAYEAGKFFVVQSRPITTLAMKKLEPQKSNPTHIDDKDWFLTVTRNMSFWHQGICNQGMYHNTPDYGVQANLELLTLVVDSTKTSAFANKANHDWYVKAVVEATKTLEKLENLKDKYIEFTKELLGSLDICKKDLSKETFDVFVKNYKRYTAGLMITTALGRVGLDELTARLKEIGYTDEEIPSIIAISTYPIEKTPFFNSQVDLLKIGLEIEEKELSKKDTDKKLESWLSKYAHVPVNFCEEPYSKGDLEAQLKEFLKFSCKEKILSFEKQHNENIAKADAMIKKVNDLEVTRLAKTLANATSLNEFRKNVFCKVSLEYRPVFAEIVSKLGSNNWRDAFYLKYEEMLEILAGKTIDLQSIMKERSRAAMYITSDGKQIYLGRIKADELYDFVYAVKPPTTSSEKILKGFSANKGKVRGIVKIILSSKDFLKLNPGEILVTTMTSVDFVPIMERAAAFVTNEGGITSHASIVAREMNKPCIIGTKNATQILKDGDMVEVDADNGLVSILE